VAANAFPLEAASKNTKLSELLKNPKAWLDGRFGSWSILLKVK